VPPRESLRKDHHNMKTVRAAADESAGLTRWSWATAVSTGNLLRQWFSLETHSRSSQGGTMFSFITSHAPHRRSSLPEIRIVSSRFRPGPSLISGSNRRNPWLLAEAGRGDRGQHWCIRFQGTRGGRHQARRHLYGRVPASAPSLWMCCQRFSSSTSARTSCAFSLSPKFSTRL
jgi:hypothetical protein